MSLGLFAHDLSVIVHELLSGSLSLSLSFSLSLPLFLSHTHAHTLFTLSYFYSLSSLFLINDDILLPRFEFRC